MYFLQLHIVQLIWFLCIISWTMVTGKPVTYLNQTMLKHKQEGIPETTTTTSKNNENKQHTQTPIPKSKYEGGPSWLLNVPTGWGAHHATHSIQRQDNHNDTNFGLTFLQHYDELIEHAFDDGKHILFLLFIPSIFSIHLLLPIYA